MLPSQVPAELPSLQALTQIAPLRHHPFTLIPILPPCPTLLLSRCLSLSSTLRASVCLFVDCCPPQLDFKPHEDEDLFTAESPELKQCTSSICGVRSHTLSPMYLSHSLQDSGSWGQEEVRCGMPSHSPLGQDKEEPFLRMFRAETTSWVCDLQASHRGLHAFRVALCASLNAL